MKITQVGTVAVAVRDQDAALEFYVATLGFEVRMDASFAPGQRWIEVAPAGAVTTVAIVAAGEDTPAGTDTGIRLATADAVADHAELQAAGVAVGELLQWPGVPPMFDLNDGDGNTLYVVER